MRNILLAEDDADFSGILKQYLELHDFAVTCAENGKIALDLFKQKHFNLCVFDVMMPEMDGFTLAEKVLEINPEIPFLFLTARQMKDDKIKGLKLGADDYISKPFEADELVLRLNNILKRYSKSTEKIPAEDEIAIGKYLFDTNRHLLKLGEHTQRLTAKEAALIAYLWQNRNILLQRDSILMDVWGNNDYFSGRSMDVFISRLRKYFNDDNAITIESIRNIGLEFMVKDS